jgi:hypothetical protein
MAYRRPVRRYLFGLGLVALGAFLLTGAGMVRWYAAPRAALVPLDPDLTVTLTGAGLAYDVAAGGAVRGALTERLAVRGGAGPAGVAVWDVDRRLSDAAGTPLRLDSERVVLDRRTAVAVGCCGDRPRHSGLTYLFPPGVARADQSVYDPATRRTVPARYVGVQDVGGTRTYRFDQRVPETDLGQRSLPGAPELTRTTPASPSAAALAAPTGSPGPVTAVRTGRLLAASQRSFWVDPATGIVVRVVERWRERLLLPTGDAVPLLDARLTTDPAGVARLTRLAADRRDRLARLRTVAPLALAAAGVVALLAGLGYRIVTTRGESPALGSTSVADRW